MVDKIATKNPSPSWKDPKRVVVSNRANRLVPLKYWFGPKVLATVTFPMEIEDLVVDPFGKEYPEPLDLTGLAPDLAGVYRPSEPLPPSVPLLGITNTRIRYIESSFRRSFIDMGTNYESYLSQFSAKTRSTIKRKVRKFEEASGGEIKWSVYQSVAEMDRFHSLAREISKLTYQEKLFDAGLPADQSFLTEMRENAKANAVRGFILFFAEKPISYLYLPIRDDRVIYGSLGFDPAFAKHSPGTVLQLTALEYLFSEDRYLFFDFTEGESVHKSTFSTHQRFCGNVFYLRSTLRNRTLVRFHLTIRKLSNFADRIIVKIGLKERLRRALRGQAGGS